MADTKWPIQNGRYKMADTKWPRALDDIGSCSGSTSCFKFETKDRRLSAVDMALVFPPQWSPFQPPLSLPSLAAWLRREGFSVASLDANISLYHWLFADE